MITIHVKQKEILFKGHADYQEYGSDIVCASVSSIVTTTVNGILTLEQNSIDYSQDDDKMTITILKSSKTVKTLLENMLSLLEQLENQYPQNVKIIK